LLAEFLVAIATKTYLVISVEIVAGARFVLGDSPHEDLLEINDLHDERERTKQNLVDEGSSLGYKKN